MTKRAAYRFSAGWISGVISASAVALVLGLWAGLSFHSPAALRPQAAEVKTGTLEVLRAAPCTSIASQARVTVTITRLYNLGDGTLLRHQRPLSEQLRGAERSNALVFHLPFGMYRVRTSVDRSVENRFVLPGVRNVINFGKSCKAVAGSYAPSLRDI